MSVNEEVIKNVMAALEREPKIDKVINKLEVISQTQQPER